MDMKRFFWVKMILALLVLVGVSAVAVEAATVTGMVTNNSGVAGRVYIGLKSSWGDIQQGVSVETSGTTPKEFSINGVQEGNYTIVAFVDRTGTGTVHVNDPTVSGPAEGILVNGSDVSAGNLTLSAPGSTVLPPTSFSPPGVLPMPGGAMVLYESATDEFGRTYADAFNLDCNDGQIVRNSVPSPTMIGDDFSLLVLNGLANGSNLKCKITPIIGGQTHESLASLYSEPVTIGESCSLFETCGSGVTVSGRVILSGFPSLVGKTLLVILSDWMSDEVYAAAAIQDPAAIQNYSIPGVKASPHAWRTEFMLFDTSTGYVGAGANLLNEQNEQARLMVDGGSAVIAPDVTMRNRNSFASVNVERTFGYGGHWSNLIFDFISGLKTPVNITLKNKSGTALPAEGVSVTGQNSFWYNTNSGFEPGTTYDVLFEYSDGSETKTIEVLKGAVEARINQSFPVGNVRIPDLSHPIAGWNYSTFIPQLPGTVATSIESNEGNWIDNLRTATNWLQHGLSSPLVVGQTYGVSTEFQDILGDGIRAWNSFTPMASGPEITSLVPSTGGAGTPVTINGSGFTGTTNVTFNGFGINFTVVNDNQITTNVPSGAARGPVTVTAGGITGASTVPFEITATISGKITNSAGGSLGGIEVNIIGAGVPLATTTNGTGDYILTVPAGIPFFMKFHDPSNNYRDVSSRWFAVAGTQSSHDYTLFSVTDISDWEARDGSFSAIKDGTAGMIRSRVRNSSNISISGATITVASKNYPQGNPAYKVIYAEAAAPNLPDPSLTSTTASGRFYVTGIEQGDTVALFADKPGYGFLDNVYQVYTGTVGAGTLRGELMPNVTLSPSGGDIINNTPVTVTLDQSGTLFYTTDGSDPRYNGYGVGNGGTLNITNSGYVTVRYVAKNLVGVFGNEFTATYNVINDITPPTVYATPPGYETFGPGTFKSAIYPLYVPFTASEPATVYYTIDNSTPTISSPALTVSTNWGSTTAIPVTTGQTLRFFAKDSSGNFSQEQAITFTSTSPVSFSGNVFSADGITPLLGATVSMMENPSLSTSTDIGGSFTLANLPQSQDLRLQLSYPGKQNTYSVIMNLNNNVSGREYRLYTLAEMQSWGHAAGTGIVRGIVQQTSAGKSPLSGAQVFIANSTGGYYPVLYDNGTGMMPGPGSSTSANGVFYILGVIPGEILTISASLNDYSFNSQRFQAQPDGVTEGRINGTINVSPSFTISAVAAANGTISPAGDSSVSMGSDQTYTITPAPGFQVAMLVVDGAQLPGATNYTFNSVTAEHYIIAYFSPLPADVTITAAAGPNGSISPAGATAVVSGSSQTYTITPAPGFQVAMLVVDGAQLPGATNYTFNSVTAEHYIIAYFSPLPADVTITAAAGPNGSISPAGATAVVSGSSQTYTITPVPGFQVAMLVVDGAQLPGATNYTFNSVTAEHYIIAYFSPLPADVTITAAAGPNGSISPAGATAVVSGSSQTYTITPVPGFQVAMLVVDGAQLPGATNYTFNSVTAEHYIIAYFSPLPADVTITAAAAPNGSISSAGATTVTGGTDKTYTITPDPGFSIAALVVDGTVFPGASTYTFTNVSGDHYIIAYFQ